VIAREKRICKYIDLPIQHINDRILKLMNRGLSRKHIENLINKIRKTIPGCFIRTSVIVGFPGETEKEFKELLGFLKDVNFERLGAFTYSREEDTPAYNFKPQIHPATKKRRLKEVMLLQKAITHRANSRLIGRKIDVLIESKDKDIFLGRTQYDSHDVDCSVFLKKKGLIVGNFYKAKIVDACDYDLIAE